MDTKSVADYLGTTPRTLRQFLRSGHSTFVPVGSGARYDFTERELPTLKKRFAEWNSAGKPRPPVAEDTAKPEKRAKPKKNDAQLRKDQEVWAEEGEVKIPDIRDAKVRAEVRRRAQADEDRLMLRLMAAGIHITQLGDRKTA